MSDDLWLKEKLRYWRGNLENAGVSSFDTIVGATDLEIASFETAIGIELAPSLRAWFRLIDGHKATKGPRAIFPDSFQPIPLAKLHYLAQESETFPNRHFKLPNSIRGFGIPILDAVDRVITIGNESGADSYEQVYWADYTFPDPVIPKPKEYHFGGLESFVSLAVYLSEHAMVEDGYYSVKNLMVPSNVFERGLFEFGVTEL